MATKNETSNLPTVVTNRAGDVKDAANIRAELAILRDVAHDDAPNAVNTRGVLSQKLADIMARYTDDSYFLLDVMNYGRTSSAVAVPDFAPKRPKAEPKPALELREATPADIGNKSFYLWQDGAQKYVRFNSSNQITRQADGSFAVRVKHAVIGQMKITTANIGDWYVADN